MDVVAEDVVPFETFAAFDAVEAFEKPRSDLNVDAFAVVAAAACAAAAVAFVVAAVVAAVHFALQPVAVIALEIVHYYSRPLRS